MTQTIGNAFLQNSVDIEHFARFNSNRPDVLRQMPIEPYAARFNLLADADVKGFKRCIEVSFDCIERINHKSQVGQPFLDFARDIVLPDPV